MTNDDWARTAGFESAGTWNSILQSDRKLKNPEARVRYLDMDKIYKIQRVAGNRAVMQYLEMREKGLLDCQRAPVDEVAELELRLAQAKVRAAQNA